jgi:hypothetical protein
VIERVTTLVLSYNKSLKECEDGLKIKLKTWFSITWEFNYGTLNKNKVS